MYMPIRGTKKVLMMIGHLNWSLPSIIVRGPAVTQNKSQLVHVMNEVWYSVAFAPKFVLRKVFSINIYI